MAAPADALSRRCAPPCVTGPVTAETTNHPCLVSQYSWTAACVTGTISVLVIEDEADIRQLLRTMLEREGFSVTEAMLGRDGVRLFHQKQPNMVILDVGMPDLDGWQVLERIRDMSDVPVLMLTALSTERDKVRGLNAGADDYLTKPFSRVELLARIQAISRRQVQRNEPIVSFEDGAIRVDFSESQVTIDGEPSCSPRPSTGCWPPWSATRARCSRPDQLIELAWDDPSGLAPSRVKYAVLRLRRKLGWGDQDDGPIETVRGLRLPLPSGPGERSSVMSSHRPAERRARRAARTTRREQRGPDPGLLRADRVRLPLFALVARRAPSSSGHPLPPWRPARDHHRRPPLLPPSHGRLRAALGAAARLGLADHPDRLHGRHRPHPRRPGRERLRAGDRLPVAHRLDVLYGRRLHLLVGLFCMDLALHGAGPARRGAQLPALDVAPGHHHGRR